MATPKEQLRDTVVRLCARMRIVTEQVCSGDTMDDEDIDNMRAMFEGFGQDVSEYEDSAEEELIPTTYHYATETREQLYASFWASVVNYGLHGTSDITGPILELEARDKAAQRAEKAGPL